MRAAIIHFLLQRGCSSPLAGTEVASVLVHTCSDFGEVLPCFSLRLAGFGNFQKNIQKQKLPEKYTKSHRLKVQNGFLCSSCLPDLASTAFSRCGILGLACKPAALDVIPWVTHTELGILFIIPTKDWPIEKSTIFFFPSIQV